MTRQTVDLVAHVAVCPECFLLVGDGPGHHEWHMALRKALADLGSLIPVPAETVRLAVAADPPKRKAVPFPCDQCDETFGSHMARSRHVTAAHSVPEGSHRCDQPDCDAVFSSRQALGNHLKSHVPIADDGDDEYDPVRTCPTCEARFPTERRRNLHAETCTGGT